MKGQKPTHEITTNESPYGWEAICSCGGFRLGFFGSAMRAKRAALNTSHGELEHKPRAEFIDTGAEK